MTREPGGRPPGGGFAEQMASFVPIERVPVERGTGQDKTGDTA